MTYSFDLKIRMINYYNNSNKSLRSIEIEFDISKSSLHRWINDICVVKKIKKSVYIQRSEILQFLKRSLDHNPFQNLELLKNKIKLKFNSKLTIKTVSNYLKIIGYSKKKITRRFYNKSLKEHKLNRRKMKKQLKKIDKENIICIDESCINKKLYANEGWCKKSKRLVRDIPNKSLLNKYSLLMAISNKKVLKYELHKDTSINTESYCKFLEDLLINIKNKYILMDNVSFHKSKRVIKIIEDSKNKILYIPPYSPDFNPIEEVFSKMKTYIRTKITPLTMNKDIFRILKLFVKLPCTFDGYYKHAFD
jgi:transposase